MSQLSPIEKYADIKLLKMGNELPTQMTPGKMLVCLGGLTCNPETGNVLDKAYEPTEGLYAAGNTMGGQFLVGRFRSSRTLSVLIRAFFTLLKQLLDRSARARAL